MRDNEQYMASAWMGRPVLRVEDATLLRGAGRFVDDIDLPGLLHASFVRSPVAHARLNASTSTQARALPGVHAVLTYADLRPLLTCDRIPLALPVGAIRFHVDPSCLAERRCPTSASRSRWSWPRAARSPRTRRL